MSGIDPRGSLRQREPIPCKLCRSAIRPGDDRVWLRKPMGLSHQTCAAEAVAAAQQVVA